MWKFGLPLCLWLVVGRSVLADDCAGSIADIISTCGSEAGLATQDLELLQGGMDALSTLTETDIVGRCQSLDQYKTFSECASEQIEECELEDSTVFSQLYTIVQTVCTDGDIQVSCLVNALRETGKVARCVVLALISMETGAEVTECMNMLLTWECMMDLTSQCDSYTGTVLREQSEDFFSTECED